MCLFAYFLINTIVKFGKCGGFFENFEGRKQVLVVVKQGK